MSVYFIQADCLEWLKAQPDNSVDLVFCSPPYEAARTYGIGFDLKGQAFVDWCLERFNDPGNKTFRHPHTLNEGPTCTALGFIFGSREPLFAWAFREVVDQTGSGMIMSSSSVGLRVESCRGATTPPAVIRRSGHLEGQ